MRLETIKSATTRLVRTALLVVLLLVATIGYACFVLDESGGEDTTVGTVLPVSGDLSTLGPGMQKAIDLAFDLVNEAGGVNGGDISALHRDSGTSEQVGTDAASGLVNVDGVNIVIGAVSSGVSIAIAESVTIPGGVLHMSPASSSNAITALADNDMVFRTRVNDGVKSQVLAELAVAAGYEQVSTTYVNNAYGASLNESFIEAFEAMGGTVTAAVSHELGQASYVSELRESAQGFARGFGDYRVSGLRSDFVKRSGRGRILQQLHVRRCDAKPGDVRRDRW